MTETAAGHTLRNWWHRYAAAYEVPLHYVRVENASGVGMPDANLCWGGKEIWLEGKHLKALPVRDSTPVRFGAKSDIRLVHQGNWLTKRTEAGGRCFIWVRVDEVEGRETGKWYLIDGTGLNGFKVLSQGIPKSEFVKLPSFDTGKDLVHHIIQTYLFR